MIRDFQTASSDRYQLLKEFARENRNNPTEAESALWRVLKGNRFGFKFKRQHIVYDFIADFICLERKLIIEEDGGYHFTNNQIEKDIYRTEILESQGYRVIRFRNEEITNNIYSVIEVINKELYGNK